MAELVGGALLSSSMSLLFNRMATREFLDLFKTRKMNEALLKELESLLHVVNGVLDDAEDRQLASPTSEVQKFLDDLRDAAYEADDLLDDINYEVTAANIQAEESSIATTSADQSWNKCCLHNPFKKLSKKRESFPTDVPRRLEKIVERLRSLVYVSGKLELKSTTSGRKEVPPLGQTTSVVNQSDIIGRDAEMNYILNLLQDNGDGIGVIPIVGMGGIGKTTMARLAFNDSRVQRMFERRAWVCVSDNYDMLRVKKELLENVNDLVGNDSMNLDQIDRKLQESLNGKKYLLVLDDLWNDNYTDWETLLAPLKSGAHGSKIIITTRNQKIAAKMGTVAKSHQLGKLDANSCWQLFAKRAFKDGEGDRKFQTIGKEIVSKCGGLPLAAIMLGGLLRGETEETKWEAVRDSNIWELSNNNPLAALRLSYQHLPSHLKQCFVYCAIFPKDYRMKKEQIIQLWMAEGFLAIRGKKMEEFGRECFDELLSRSFFQEVIEYGEPCFLMHDLINDLAKLICGEFLIRMDDDNSCDFSARNRYFSFIKSKADSCKTLVFDGNCKAQFLRSMMSCYAYNRKVDDAVVNDLISHLRCLRVLSLEGFSEVVNFPKAIGYLKHMRYLNLKETKVKRLPESVCTLYNLQTVILCGCHNLVHLPSDFGNLINLHFLDIRLTSNLQEMPPKMGNLKDLRTLSKFSVGKQNGSDINELAALQHLRGELYIFNLQNEMGNPKDILKNKMHLEHLELEWSRETEDSDNEERVLEGLKPYKSIITLSISGYGGKNFPDWIGDSFYSNIVSLKLHGCKNCTNFPLLGQLSSLEDLSISKFDVVEEVCMKTPLHSLKTLHIKDMKQWQKWIFAEENDCEKRGSLAKLEELRIEQCPELKFISRCGPTHMIFESLNCLMVDGCSPCLNVTNLLANINLKLKNKPARDSSYYFYGRPMVKLEQLPSAMHGLYINKLRAEGLEEMGNALNALEDVRIRESESVECIPLEVFPVLKSLVVYKCDNLKSLSACGEPLPHPLTFLTSLKIIDCRSLIRFPKGGISAPNLTYLELLNCSSLKSLPEGMHHLLPSLEKLNISHCEEVESFPEGGLPSKLKSVEISYCNDKVISGVLQWGLQTLDVLSELSLWGYEGNDLDFFPQETLLLPSSLTSLQISDFKNLKYINCKAIQHLAKLSVFGCPNLQSFVEGGLASSVSVESIEEVGTESSLGGGNLQSLRIESCDKLICSRLQWGMQRFNALSHLTLRNCDGDDLDSFPEESVLPSTLTSLTIWDFENLKGINYKGLQHLTSLSQLEITNCPNFHCLPREGLPSSLSELKISYCPNLQCLPEQGLPASLSLLDIWDCPMLEKSCKREIGEDWPKISHISTIKMNLRTI